MKMKELLVDPKRWTKGALARDKNGNIVHFEYGYSFCLLGAMCKCYPEEEERDRVKDKVKEVIDSPIDWNDDEKRTHAEVLALLERLDV